MSWRAHLQLHYSQAAGRCTGRIVHEGPLRVLKSLYPEGPGICHHVLVHPPGGVVGGDELHIQAQLGPGSHAVITTPGATRFYRSEGATAVQHSTLQLQAGARLEWLPLEAIAHRGCLAQNQLRLQLAAGAEAIAWDILALGLPASGEAFDSADAEHSDQGPRGCFLQHLELAGAAPAGGAAQPQWLERGLIRADDTLLLHSPLGLAGQPVTATLGFFAGQGLAPARRQALLDAAREAIASAAAPGLAARAGATAPQPGVVVLRVLGPRVEPVLALLAAVRAAWRRQAWGLAAAPLRIWAT